MNQPTRPQRAWSVADLVLQMNQEDPTDRPQTLHPGDPCPKCGEGRLDYNGLLNLVCNRCDYEQGGCFT